MPSWKKSDKLSKYRNDDTIKKLDVIWDSKTAKTAPIKDTGKIQNGDLSKATTTPNAVPTKIPKKRPNVLGKVKNRDKTPTGKNAGQLTEDKPNEVSLTVHSSTASALPTENLAVHL